MLVVDSSSSVGEFRWMNEVRRFLDDFAPRNRGGLWRIGLGADETQVALVTYSTDAGVAWNWNSTITEQRSNIRNALRDRKHLF